ncbi:MAG: DNA-binding LytR/AlgR family response regulator [Saprospiraceae bacterium]|jgi:DNA-binding LytR/AlgR family response regulator
MKCIIVDDEPLAREGIELNVQDVSYLELIGQFSNAADANTFLQENDVDLMFLDIQMPGITGLDFIRSLKNAPLVILTTAYPQYALEGFELDVVDYLMKPVRLARFVKACNKAKELYDLMNIPKNTVEKIAEDFIYIKADRKYIRLFFKEIHYIKGMKDYVMLYTEKQRVMTAMNIKTIFSQLPSSIFARVSKSHIINVDFIDSVEIDFIQLKGEEIPLGRTYKEKFLQDYVKGKLIGRK